MAADYQLLAGGLAILRIADGATIPLAGGNADYQAYLAWVALGNTADPSSLNLNPVDLTFASDPLGGLNDGSS